jgi:hypothetical protein
LPDTVPEYVIAAEPTVPKRMELPCTVPLMLVLAFGVAESLIVPVNRDPDSVQ